jgi:hypothetical protein
MQDDILQRRQLNLVQDVKTLIRIVSLAAREKKDTLFIFETIR